MRSERPSPAHASVSAPRSEWSSLPADAVRVYRDDALIERVRLRLDAGRTLGAPSRRVRVHRVWQAAAALLVFGIGVGVGQRLPDADRESTAQREVVRATAETRTGATVATRARAQDRADAVVRPSSRRTERKHGPRAKVTATTDVPSVPGSEQETLGLELPPALPATAPLPSPRSSWLDLADSGDYAGALGELERSQATQVVLATGSVEELMTMAEVARFAGNQERAIQALSQVVDRYGGDPNAPLAAMMLGNLLSRSGDAAGAARAYAANRTLSPGGDFAEDALVREFDLALAARDLALAQGLFDQYAREFPAGPSLYAMRYELDELLAEVEADARPDGQANGGTDRPLDRSERGTGEDNGTPAEDDEH